MSEDEDTSKIDENSSSIYDDDDDERLFKKKKRTFFFKKNRRKNEKGRPGMEHNSNNNNVVPKWYNKHQVNPVIDIHAERKTDANVSSEAEGQDINTNSIKSGDLEDSSTTRCGCLGKMFGYLKRKLLRNGSSTHSKRARLKDEETIHNVATSSRQESSQDYRRLCDIEVQTDLPIVIRDHCSSELVNSELDVTQGIQPVKKRKKKNRRKIQLPNSTKNKNREMPEEIRNNPNLKKYWINRYRLFSKYDEGIKLDAESWYSVTAEKISEEIARRCQCDVIIDGFCGAGGNTIQFAFVCERVIAIDIDVEKIKLAKHNAEIYGVADRIEFIVGDFFQIAPSLSADVVFLSPPWGGPSYKYVEDFPMSLIMEPYGGKHLYDIAKQISDHIAYFLPRNINASEIAALEPGEYVKIDKNYLDGRLVAITAYFGDLVEDYGDEWNN